MHRTTELQDKAKTKQTARRKQEIHTFGQRLFRTPLSVVDRTSPQKISKSTEGLKKIITELDLPLR